jgi:hypothetical protein
MVEHQNEPYFQLNCKISSPYPSITTTFSDFTEKFRNWDMIISHLFFGFLIATAEPNEISVQFFLLIMCFTDIQLYLKFQVLRIQNKNFI